MIKKDQNQSFGPLQRLESKIAGATGSDTRLDQAIWDTIDTHSKNEDIPPYTASLDACLSLIKSVLPDWHWHVGHGPRGLLPYATLSSGKAESEVRVEMFAPTVPLALLGALIKALRSGQSLANRSEHSS